MSVYARYILYYLKSKAYSLGKNIVQFCFLKSADENEYLLSEFANKYVSFDNSKQYIVGIYLVHLENQILMKIEFESLNEINFHDELTLKLEKNKDHQLIVEYRIGDQFYFMLTNYFLLQKCNAFFPFFSLSDLKKHRYRFPSPDDEDITKVLTQTSEDIKDETSEFSTIRGPSQLMFHGDVKIANNNIQDCVLWFKLWKEKICNSEKILSLQIVTTQKRTIKFDFDLCKDLN